MADDDKPRSEETVKPVARDGETESAEADDQPREIGGFDGLEPTRYGDWEQNGRCTDF